MSTTGLNVFDTTLKKTTIWLNSIMEQMGWEDRQHAYITLRGVLHALRDRLTPEEAADLGAQLPMLVRGFYFEGWNPAHTPQKYKHKEEFLERVTKEARFLQGEELEKAVGVVFKVLEDNVSGGEIKQVKSQLPAEVQQLWP
jgi:uncharacterized protein (DUF2267 family)